MTDLLQEQTAGAADAAPYVAYHGQVIVKNATDSHSTGRKVQLKFVNEDDINQFKTFSKRRKGKAGVVYKMTYRMVNPVATKKFVAIECFFLGVNWSNTQGGVVAFELDGQEDWEPFRNCSAIAGGSDFPQVLEILLFEIDEDGEVIDQKQAARVEAVRLKARLPKGGPQSKRAAMLCRDSEFHDWLGSLKIDTGHHEAQAASWIRETCEIQSRAELDHNPKALALFASKVTGPFNRWRGQQYG